MPFNPQITVSYNIQGQPHIHVDCQDRAGTRLDSPNAFQSSPYLPYLQVFTKQVGDSDYNILYDWWMNPDFDINAVGRTVSVMVRLWDKMPNESDYTKYYDGLANISIDAPHISSVVVQDCKERNGSEKIAGQAILTVTFDRGWQKLRKIDVFAGIQQPVDISENAITVQTYIPSSPSDTHTISITNLTPDIDYFLSLVPYDSIGIGTVFTDGYAYICSGDDPDPEEGDECVVAPCIVFTQLNGTEYVTTALDSPILARMETTDFTLLEAASLDDILAGRYELTAKTDKGVTSYVDYSIVVNPSGEYVGQIAQETTTSISPNNLRFEFENAIADGAVGVFARVIFKNPDYPSKSDVEVETDTTKTRIALTAAIASLSIVPSPQTFSREVSVETIEIATSYSTSQIATFAGSKLNIRIDGSLVTTSEGAQIINKNGINFLRFVFSRVNTIPILRYKLAKAEIFINNASNVVIPNLDMVAYQDALVQPPYSLLQNLGSNRTFVSNAEIVTTGNVLTTNIVPFTNTAILDTTPFNELEISAGFGFNRVFLNDIEFLYPETETYQLNSIMDRIRIYRISSTAVETLVGEYPLSYTGREGVATSGMPNRFRAYIFSGINMDTHKADGERIVIRFYLGGTRVSPRFYTSTGVDTSSKRDVFLTSGAKNICALGMGLSNEEPWMDSPVTVKGVRRAFAT